MNLTNGTISINRQRKKAPGSASFAVWLAVLLSFGLVKSVEATIVTIGVPCVGTQMPFIQDFSILNPLEGTFLNGQSQSVNIFFTNNEFLVAAGFSSATIDLFISQSGPIGTWPTNRYCVTGYLIDAAGNPVTPPVGFPDSGSIPAQVWSGWPFYLPDGTQYLPATKMFESQFSGNIVYGSSAGFYINPIVFSGIHFDIKYPVSPANEILGGRIVIANFDDPIFNTPNPVPTYLQYFVGIPDPTLGLVGMSNQGSGGVGGTNALILQMFGTPNYPYILQSTTNLANPVWQSLMTNSADINGIWNITVTNLQGIPCEYFRVAAWPGQ